MLNIPMYGEYVNAIVILSGMLNINSYHDDNGLMHVVFECPLSSIRQLKGVLREAKSEKQRIEGEGWYPQEDG